jgi:hypothetical protein
VALSHTNISISDRQRTCQESGREMVFSKAAVPNIQSFLLTWKKKKDAHTHTHTHTHTFSRSRRRTGWYTHTHKVFEPREAFCQEN